MAQLTYSPLDSSLQYLFVNYSFKACKDDSVRTLKLLRLACHF